MTRTVVALFDDFASANDALRELLDNGFSRDDVSMIANDTSGRYARYITDKDAVDTSATNEGAGVGAGIGAIIGGLGGLLVGLGALTIPGIGPVLAAGPLAAALSGLAGAGVGAVAGGVTGGLLGALVDLGVPEESANYYAEGVRRGGTLLTVRTPDTMTDRAVDILNRHDPVDINKRASQWRESGWDRFNPSAEPFSTHETGTMASNAPLGHTREDEMVAGRNRGSSLETGSMAGGMTPQGERMTDGEEGSIYGTHAPEQMASHTYSDFTSYDPDFRSHFQTTMAGTGYTYDQYLPAYRYGYDLATDTRYRDYDWNRVEPEARRYWEERNPGSWERFKLAVQHAWEEIKDAVD